jgi:hypothetical protein
MLISQFIHQNTGFKEYEGFLWEKKRHCSFVGKNLLRLLIKVVNSISVGVSFFQLK